MGIERLKFVIAVVVVAVLISAVGVSLLRVRVFPVPAKPHSALGQVMCGLTAKCPLSQIRCPILAGAIHLGRIPSSDIVIPA
jgi:hypothetical protein